jgi:hypothetical protein
LISATFGASAETLFDKQDIIKVELRGPLGELFEDKANKPRAFELESNGVTHAVRAITGGKSRQIVCSFPPIGLRFDENRTPKTGDKTDHFSGQNFLRMVTHCKPGTRSQANVIEEYLAYRIFNLITEFSYRVRLLQVKYTDTAQDRESITRHAFVVESEYELAQRVGGEVLEINGLPKQKLNETLAAQVYVFQYLIGNTDWSLVTAQGEDKCCHNGQLIDIDAEILYIPYDFDITGLVNPRYAKPDRSLPIKRVTTRLYRGYCGPRDELRAALTHIVERREAIISLYRQAPVLSESERNRGIKYLDGFFRKAQDPEKLLDLFERRCLG